MALLQIQEPNETVSIEKKHAVGIDLGTTNSLVATLENGNLSTLPDMHNQDLLPSVVRYLDDDVEVGASAYEAATSDPSNTIVSVKRLIGYSTEELKNQGIGNIYMLAENESIPNIITRQGPQNPIQISAKILQTLKKRACSFFKAPLDGAVVTVPAYFDESQRQATKDAAKLAGLPLLRLLSEPTAAAIAYGLDKKHEKGTIAVYDLGGGTFDLSILRIEQGVFEVLATGGDSALGGDDFDLAIVHWILRQIALAKTPHAEQIRTLLKLAKNAKEQLSQAKLVTLEYQDWKGRLTREQFYQLIEPLIEHSLDIFHNVMIDANITPEALNAIILVGGSTRIPRIPASIKRCFHLTPLADLDPDKVVAYGAAIQADILVGNEQGTQNPLLLDVVPLSLGIETLGGLVEKIIPRNATIPIQKTQEFTTAKDGQTGIDIHVVQGERELVKDNRSLARFKLTNIPPLPAGSAKIAVTFQIDADSLLHVEAKEVTSGITTHIEVKPSYGLTKQDLINMLKTSQDHAQKDIQIALARKEKIKAEQLVTTLSQAIEIDAKLLSKMEYAKLKDALETLQKALKTDDIQIIKQKFEQLTKLSDVFASRRMNAAITKVLKGKAINQWNP